MLEFKNVGVANYNALQVSLTRRYASSKLGSAFYTFAYTWSHELDNVSGFRQRNSQVPYYDEHYFWASGDTDVRQVIAFSGGWDLPFDHLWEQRPETPDQRLEPVSDLDLAHRLSAGCKRPTVRHYPPIPAPPEMAPPTWCTPIWCCRT